MRSYSAHRKRHKPVYSDIKDEWERFEREYWERHPGEKYCHVCGEKKHVELHHICPRHICPDRIFSEDNLIPLCRACHFRWGHLNDWELWNPDIRDDAEFLFGLHEKRRRDASGGRR